MYNTESVIKSLSEINDAGKKTKQTSAYRQNSLEIAY